MVLSAVKELSVRIRARFASRGPARTGAARLVRPARQATAIFACVDFGILLPRLVLRGRSASRRAIPNKTNCSRGFNIFYLDAFPARPADLVPLKILRLSRQAEPFFPRSCDLCG